MPRFFAYNCAPSYTGIGVYAQMISDIVGKDNVISVILNKNKKNLQYPGRIIDGLYPPISSGWSLNRSFFKSVLRRRGILSPDFEHYLDPHYAYSSGSGTIVTFHDMYHLASGQRREAYKTKLENKFKACENIISDSQSTKEDMLKVGFDENQIEVIHLAIKPFWKKLKEDEIESSEYFSKIQKKNKNKLPVVLTVGDGPYKNNDKVHKAAKGKFFHIHVGNDVLTDLNLLNVNEHELRILYNIANIHCRIADFEGFGFPPIEALSCGTSTVVSNLGVYHETIGDAGSYALETTPEGIADAIQYALDNGDSLLSKFNNGRRKHFSIERFNKEMHAYYSKRGIEFFT